MRINVRPYVTRFDTGEATQHAVSVVGRMPHRTAYIEEPVGTVEDLASAPLLVGASIERELVGQEFQRLSEKHGAEQAQQMLELGQVQVKLPVIPGVTTEGLWTNASFGDKDRHRARHGMKPRISA